MLWKIWIWKDEIFISDFDEEIMMSNSRTLLKALAASELIFPGPASIQAPGF